MNELIEGRDMAGQRDVYPVPTDGCDVCAALVEQRRLASVAGDSIGVKVANREIVSHPHGFTTFAEDEPGYVPVTIGDNVMNLHKGRNAKPLCDVEVPPYSTKEQHSVTEWPHRHVTCPACLALPG
ncbi:hypothetical protein [Streptomyces sp. NPDC050264]|uniref:hypothetical protein n=1 Tax=Streptomyces sp. NPDC050264 TaxID=3155038 RepID=UPI00342F885E